MHVISTSKDNRPAVEALGFEVKTEIFTLFEVAEDDERWPEVARLVKEWKAQDIQRTDFAHEEVLAAEHVCLVQEAKASFPQPKNNFEYRRIVYDLSGYCQACGAGMRQIAPFRVDRRPRWGPSVLGQIHWTDDEFFCAKKLWGRVFEPLGVGCWPVFRKQDIALADFVQLRIEQTSASPLRIPENAPASRCPHCRAVKLQPWRRGHFPPFAEPVSAPVVRSREWFGSGYAAFKAVIVAREVAAAMLEHGVYGVRYWPLRPMLRVIT